MCFDISNHLQRELKFYRKMISLLNWIGCSVDIAPLKFFFSQNALTICATWEALISAVCDRRHRTAFDVLLSVHLSILGQAPWNTDSLWRYFPLCVKLAPSHAATLIDHYQCNQSKLDKALQCAALHGRTELVKQLVSASAFLKNKELQILVDGLIRYIGSRECEAADLALLETLLEAGAAVDEIRFDQMFLSCQWTRPHCPRYATDYLLLRERQCTRSDGLCALVSSYSDRQKTAITVSGIFQAAKVGRQALRSYLKARLKPYNSQDRKKALEVALSEASGRGYAAVVQSLAHFGVDLNVSLLLETRKGTMHPMQWHPVVRAANTGEVDTLRILTTIPSIDIAFLGENVGLQLDLCALRSMKDYQRDQILSIVSAFGLPTSIRSRILLSAMSRCRHHDQCDSRRGGPDYGFVSQLLELGVACIDRGEHPNDHTSHILVRAVTAGCDLRAMKYLLQRDHEVVSALSAGTIRALCEATFERRHGRQEMLEFFAENIEGFHSSVQENGSSLLSFLAKQLSSGQVFRHASRHGECEATVTVKWLLGLGATLTAPCLANLIGCADDSFILAWIHTVTDANADDIYAALRKSISIGWLNLAVVLIEKGAPVNNPPGWRDRNTALQEACKSNAPVWFIEFLVDNGADVNAPSASTRGHTALQAACRSGAQLRSISLLLNRGADVNAPPASDAGYTALQGACAGKAPLACINFLLDRGADVDAPVSPVRGSTALQCAAINGSMNVVGLLLDHGADVNAISGLLRVKRPCIYRALDFAARSSRLDMVHFLLAAGARSSEPGCSGFEGAIGISTMEGNLTIARLLREHSGFHSGDPMEAERGWLQSNPHACMYKGAIQDAAWVDLVKRSRWGGRHKDDFRRHLRELAN